MKDTLLAAIDASELIGQHVQLTQSGNEWRGRCPFHADNNDSFYVNTEKGLYHCFGCKAGGNVIDFVMATENLDFMEAMETLAGRYGIEIKRSDGDQQRWTERQRLLAINTEVIDLYRDWL